MNDPKWTKGPWKLGDEYERYCIREMPGGPIATPDPIVSAVSGQPVISASEWVTIKDADLLLMVSAPELFEALNRLRASAENVAERDYAQELTDEDVRAMRLDILRATNAIAKATGATP